MAKADIRYHDVSRETFKTVDELYDQFHSVLETYIQRLLWWNERINLVSRDATIELVRNHVKHSLFPATLHAFQDASLILDAGSGGGLPGIPLALSFLKKKFVLNDISSKKTGILSHLKRELGIQNVIVGNFPLKKYPFEQPNVECIVSKHAFKLTDILNDIENGSWKTLIMLKGDDFESELKQISYPIFIHCYRLYTETRLPFYRGKVMLSIQRMG